MGAEHSSTRRANDLIFAPGAVILRQGEPGTTAYVVVDGMVDVFVGETRVATVGPGGLVGELAVITGEPRNATVVARTKCWLRPIESHEFADLAQHNPYFSSQLIQQLSERVQSYVRRLADDQAARPTPDEKV